jgi:hypothetical protein
MKYLIRIWGVTTLLASLLLFLAVIATLPQFAVDKKYQTQTISYNIGYLAGYIGGDIALFCIAYLLFRYSIKKMRGN